MAIFSRRTLQRLIDENTEFLSKKQIAKHIDALNLNKPIYQEWLESEKNINDLIEVYLNTEWEVAILNSLSKFGKISHEKKIGRSEPDIFFTYENNFEFVGDITCITGKQDKDNISLAFKNEFKEIIDREHPSGFWEISLRGNSREMDFCKVKPRLMLEGKTQWREIFTSQEFIKFIVRVKDNPERRDSFDYKKVKENPEPRLPNQIEMYRNVLVDIDIRYEPRTFYQVEYRQFDDRKIVSIENDEIYKSLLKKYNQLIKTNYDGCLGIFLCDGIGNTFNRGDLLYTNSRDVVNKFLADYQKIDFVLTITSEIKQSNYLSKPEVKIVLFQGYGNKLNSKIVEFLENHLIKVFSKPARTIVDARDALKFRFLDKETIISAPSRGLVVSSDEVKISSRTLLELLAGKLSLEKVSYYLGFDSYKSSIPNDFLTELNDGNLFSDVSFEKGENGKDDDWIIFRFSEDVSISPFRMPNKYE